MDSVTYTRLPGQGFGIFRRDQVWLAADHLLSIRSSRFIDQYERFYFGHIQAITFRDQRSHYFGILIAHLLPCLFFLALLAYSPAWLIPLLPLASWTAAYAWLGSQGECYLETLLGVRTLPGITQREHYDQLLERLTPLIEEAQGPALQPEPQTPETLTPELLVPEPRTPALLAPEQRPPAPPSLEPSPEPSQPLRGWYFEGTFLTTVLGALFAVWNHRGRHGDGFDLAEYALALVGFLLVLFALARAYRISVGGGVLAALWTIMVSQAVYGAGLAVASAIRDAQPRLPGPVSRLFDPHPVRTTPGLLPYATAIEAVCILAAVLGLYLILDRKNRQLS